MDHQISRSVLYDFVRDRYLDACALVLPEDADPQMRYQGYTQDEPADGSYWCRVSRIVVAENQETLRNGDGVRRFRSTGIVFAQLFAPRSDSRSQVRIDIIAESLRNAFRTFQPEDLEFTNAVIDDSVAGNPGWIAANVSSNYDYRQFIS